MTTPPPPPPTAEVFREDLNPERLKALEADLVAIVAVAVVTESGMRAPLRRAFAALRAGTTRGIRVAYRHEGGSWVDTLVPTGDGRVRLVRVRRSGLSPED